MWNCDWEYANQETLRQWYEEKISGASPNSAVQRIICKGCGRIFLYADQHQEMNQYARRANETGSIYAADIADLQNRLEGIWELSRQSLARLAAIR